MYSVNYFSSTEDGKHIYKHKEYFFFRANAEERVKFIKKYHRPVQSMYNPYINLKPYIRATENVSFGNIWRAFWKTKELYAYC